MIRRLEVHDPTLPRECTNLVWTDLGEPVKEAEQARSDRFPIHCHEGHAATLAKSSWVIVSIIFGDEGGCRARHTVLTAACPQCTVLRPRIIPRGILTV
jgi:hypothetical protein